MRRFARRRGRARYALRVVLVYTSGPSKIAIPARKPLKQVRRRAPLGMQFRSSSDRQLRRLFRQARS